MLVRILNTLGNGVKRIIFSLFSNNIDKHTSATDFKRTQFKKYSSQILAKHKEYATIVGADYKLFTPKSSDYNLIQFEKLLMFEKLMYDYDEILYLDFDVIPIRNTNIFEVFDLNTICAFNIECNMDKKLYYWLTNNNEWHTMDMYSKSCHKRSMLMLDGDFGNQTCLNTGVVAMNKSMVTKLNLNSQMDDLKLLSKEAALDTIYPEAMVKKWIFNNEVVLSYLIEKHALPFTNIGMPWNFIIDDTIPTISNGAYFLHFVHKKFEMYFTQFQANKSL